MGDTGKYWTSIVRKPRSTLETVPALFSKGRPFLTRAVSLHDVSVKKSDFSHHANSPLNLAEIIFFGTLPSTWRRKPFNDKQNLSGRQLKRFLCASVLDFWQQMANYRLNDVIVLQKCALKFQEDFMKLTKTDPFTGFTIAVACQRYFGTYVMKKKLW